MTAPTTPEEAYAAGHAAWAAGVPLHDITGHLDLIGVPTALRGRWISGLEDAMEEDGVEPIRIPTDTPGSGGRSPA